MLSLLNHDAERLCVQANSLEETVQLGQSLADHLEPGTVIALVGDLGAGKTHFVKAVATALGVSQNDVNSPTFTLIQEYSGRIPIRHCDTYRLRRSDEFVDLGLDDLFSPDGIAFVEWADRVQDDLPRDVLRVRIEITSPTARTFEFVPTGRSSRTLCRHLYDALVKRDQ